MSLIRTRRIATQEELTAYLARGGLLATQSSVSRDLEELGVIKQHGHYTLPGTNGSGASRGLLSLDSAGDALIVAKCEPGLASAVAVEIDRAKVPEIIGTLAGEDTVFIAVAEQRIQRTVIKKLWKLFE